MERAPAPSPCDGHLDAVAGLHANRVRQRQRETQRVEAQVPGWRSWPARERRTVERLSPSQGRLHGGQGRRDRRSPRGPAPERGPGLYPSVAGKHADDRLPAQVERAFAHELAQPDADAAEAGSAKDPSPWASDCRRPGSRRRSRSRSSRPTRRGRAPPPPSSRGCRCGSPWPRSRDAPRSGRARWPPAPAASKPIIRGALVVRPTS